MSLPLNPAQQAGVDHRGGPLLLLAGAGTGKTRVITHRVVALIGEGVPAWRILAVTFTNKAAGEMRERIAGLLGMDLDELRRNGPWIGTFHSICARILRRNGEGVGLSRNFAIYDVDDQKKLMRRVLDDLDIDSKLFSVSAALGKLDQAKNQGLGLARIDELGLWDPVREWTQKAWKLYEQRMRAADAADFGDLLTLTVELLRKAGAPAPDRPGRQLADVDPVVGLRRRFQHVVVDEYQDTNPVQAELVDLLAERAELCVVGDDDQAIYGWRGADVKQILAFPDRHPGCEVIRLEQNYRSTSLILDCANAVIRLGRRRHEKQLWSELGPGEPVELHGFVDERMEARHVASFVQQAIDHDATPSQIAVFYRTHAQSRPLEEALRLHGIHYRMLGGIRFYDRKEIKDLIAYLRLMTNPGSDLDCLRIINVPARRIGAKTIETLTRFALAQGISVFAACGRVRETELGRSPAKAVADFHQVVVELGREAAGLTHDQAAALVLERTGYADSIADEPEGNARLENLQEFLGSLQQFVLEQPEATLAEYLEQISLATDADDTVKRDDAITLMTIHSAKGLEFDHVLLTGMEEGVFPHMRVIDGEDPDGLEEELRLAYVALTRARKRLLLSHVERRFLWGTTKENEPSRFLRALPEGAVVRYGRANKPARKRSRSGSDYGAASAYGVPAWKPERPPSWNDDIELDPEYAPREAAKRLASPPASAAPSERASIGAAQASLDFDLDKFDPLDVLADDAGPAADEPMIVYDEPAATRVYVGMRIRHVKWGVGSVIGWSGTGEHMKLNLRFASGSRTILARYCEVLG
ncbi:ATP-dependent helicase [Nannocystaceae bacterium ST9]